MTGKLHTYSIMNLDVEHIDEICNDIKQQYETGVANRPMFNMTLVPEGNPPKDKVLYMCDIYRQFKSKLDEIHIPNGVLVQASIGHGWILSELFPFQPVVNFNDGNEVNVVCPYDIGFREYIYNALVTIAKCNPDYIMIDDDFRLIFREGNGCACPMHMKRFNELAETDFSREELLEVLKSDANEEKRFKKIYVETQRESLVETAKIMRRGIDSVNPKIPGAFCCVGNNVEFADEIAAILAGSGNPVVVRINNGNYCAAGARWFSDVFFRAAAQIEKLRNKVDIILAEPDTCPQNRYSTGAMSLHTHFTGSIIEGAKGAKHWITRLQSYEPQSGVAYRKVLSRNHKFYEKLSELVSDVKWRGCRMPILSKPFFDFKENNGGIKEEPNAWGSCVLERLGLPMYFSVEQGGIACVAGEMVDLYSDEQIIELLKGKVFIASDSAKKLIDRGFLKYLGVNVRNWDGLKPSGELLFVNGNTVKTQVNVMCLEPIDSSVTTYSTVFHQVGGEKMVELFPGITLFKNDIGGTVSVFSGTPKARYNLVEAFSFLNYSRKLQLIKLMEDLGELPVYYCGDEEMYMRCADMQDGKVLCALFNLGLDPIEQVIISTENEISSVHRLMPDGCFRELEFSSNHNEHTINSSCNTLDPLILVLTK